MRPDLEDYSDMDETPAGTRSRAMSWMVLVVAVGGFAALAYYAYHSGTQTAASGEIVTVEADGAPIKEAPANPEGEQFPNKDKTIYDVIAPADGDKKAEKLLPDAEHPVAAADNEDSEEAPSDSATTFVASPEAKKADPVDTASVVKSGDKTTAAPVTPVTTSASNAVTTQVPTTAPVKAEPKSYAAPEMINEKPATAKKDADKPAPAAKPVVKATEKPKAVPAKAAASTSTGGGSTVQLGAFKSQDEANAAWKKISAKFPDTLKGSPTIVKAEVNGGTFYRLRTSVADAKAACATLSAAKQACFPAGK